MWLSPSGVGQVTQISIECAQCGSGTSRSLTVFIVRLPFSERWLKLGLLLNRIGYKLEPIVEFLTGDCIVSG